MSEKPKPFTRIEDLDPIDWEGTSNENTSAELNNKSIESRSVVRSFDVNRSIDFKQVFYTDFLSEKASSIEKRASKRGNYQSQNYLNDQSLWFSDPVDYSDELDDDLDSDDNTRTSSSVC